MAICGVCHTLSCHVADGKSALSCHVADAKSALSCHVANAKIALTCHVADTKSTFNWIQIVQISSAFVYIQQGMGQARSGYE